MSKTNKDRLEILVSRQQRCADELKAAHSALQRAQQRLARAEKELAASDDAIKQFNRESLISPNLKSLPIESRVRRNLNKAGINTIYDLKFALLVGSYVQGIGEKNWDRLGKIVTSYYAGQEGVGQ